MTLALRLSSVAVDFSVTPSNCVLPQGLKPWVVGVCALIFKEAWIKAPSQITEPRNLYAVWLVWSMTAISPVLGGRSRNWWKTVEELISFFLFSLVKLYFPVLGPVWQSH